MKISIIQDESAKGRTIGYLFYFEKRNVFSVELSDTITESEVPLFFASFVRKGIRTINPEWSMRWVRTRIVPAERQNIRQILKEHNIDEYNEYRMLMLGCGRCAQDDCVIKPVKQALLPSWVKERLNRKLSCAVALPGKTIIACFKDGSIRRVDINNVPDNNVHLGHIINRPEKFLEMELASGGLGVCWGTNAYIAAEQLYNSGELLPLTQAELSFLIQTYVMDTAQVCNELNCSRQYVNSLVRSNDISVVKNSGNNRLYERSSVELLKD